MGAQVGQASGDWRAFRAALVAQEAGAAAEESARPAEDRAAQDWVHPIALPERGCLLLARHPDMEPAFADAVIFLLECGARFTCRQLLAAGSASCLTVLFKQSSMT